MVTHQPGQVVLIAFVRADVGDLDLVVARLTSQPHAGEFDVALQEWREAGLLLPSTARVHKLATLEKRLVERVLGTLTSQDWNLVRERVQRFCDQILSTAV